MTTDPSRARSDALAVIAPDGRPETNGGVPATSQPPPRVPSSLELEPLDDLETTRESWIELAERSGNVFSTWEWASTWWQHFGDGRPLRLLGARRPDGSLAAIVPLYEAASRPLRIVRFIGHGFADQLGPVCAPADRAAVTLALTGALAEGSLPWDLLLAERLPPDAAWSDLEDAVVVRREPSPVLEIEGRRWDEFLAHRSANFRSQVRGRERRLEREHDLRFRLADDPERLGDDLNTLFRLHDARWGAESSSFTPAKSAFHRSFAAAALERGWLRLWLAEAHGRPVAVWYGFRFGGVEWYYQAGRDPAWDRLSVGFVLLAHTIRQAFVDEMHEYRLLLGAEAYKDRFATSDPGVETVGLGGARRGLATLRALEGTMLAKGAGKVAGCWHGTRAADQPLRG